MITEQGAQPKHAYEVKSTCPRCGREHITVFKLRHISDGFFAKLGDFFQYATHTDPQGVECGNSGKSPNWGPR